MTRVLIVDDDDSWGRLARQKLEAAGFDATFHFGSLGALKVICSGGYDLLILDVVMPGLDGPRIAHMLYHVRAFPRPKVILWSSMNPLHLQELAQKLKAEGFFSKSAGADKLVQIVRDVCEPPGGERVSRIVANDSADAAVTRCPVCGQRLASGDS